MHLTHSRSVLWVHRASFAGQNWFRNDLGNAFAQTSVGTTITLAFARTRSSDIGRTSMSNEARTRRNLELFYHQKYKPYPSNRTGICLYCGLPASCVDHCPALSSVMSVGSEYCEENKIPLFLVPSCSECNHLIGARVLWTIEERRAFIAGRLKKRYKRICNLPAWSDEDIAKLGRGLKSMVRRNEDLRKITIRRIAFAENL